jgi:putative ABC transport system substrate-binding protein
MRRRNFITLLGGVLANSASWSLAARAQQPERLRRIGVLISVAEDSYTEARITAFKEELQKLGWTSGRNVQIDVRWAAGDLDTIHKFASELVVVPSDVIVANGVYPTQTLRRITRTIPIVFVLVLDPVGQGIVDSLAHPGGNVTGFSQSEFAISGKWLGLLKQIAPRVSRVGVLRDPSDSSQYAVIQAVAQSLGVELAPPIGVGEPSEIERGVTAFAAAPNGGLIVTTSQFTLIHRELIVDLAARHGLPAVYPSRPYATSGGLLSYGPDFIDQYRRAAGYVDRILKGEKPADLPVQAPTKYELIINLKTAKALDLTVPTSLLATADEVIEK